MAPDNDGPIVGNVDLGATLEDTSVIFTEADLLANSSDVDGDDLSVTSVSVDAEFGTVTDNGDGTYTFEPAEDYTGEDVPMSFTASDGTSSASATAIIDVTPVNDGPVAADDAAGTDEDSSVNIDVLANDTDVDGDTLVVTGATVTSGEGSVTVEADGSLTYDPGTSYNGLDDGETATVEISYDISDGQGGTDTATATVTVTGSNDGPVAVDDSFSGTEDQAINGNVIPNDTDADGDTLSVVAETITTANGGTVELSADGTFTYTPAADFNGEDSFSYTLSDGTATDTGTVTLDVAPDNDGPIVGNVDLADILEDTSITFTDDELMANSSDVDGDDLSVTSVSVDAEFGTVTDNGDGTYTFEPAEHFNGDDVPISFTVTDGADSASATASIDVIAVADSPILSLSVGVATTETFTGGTIDSGNVLTSDDGFTVTATAIGEDGELTDALPGNVLIDTRNGTISVGGGSDARDTDIGYDSDAEKSEELIINFEEDLTTITFGYEDLHSNEGQNGHDEEGQYTLYLDGVEVGSGSFFGTSGGHEGFVTIEAEGGFDQIVFTAAADVTGGAQVGHSDYVLTSVVYELSGNGVTAYTYPLDVSVELVDMDGSETLSAVTFGGVPVDATLSAGTDNGDGTWTVEQDDLDGLTITVTEEQQDFTLSASLGSTEESNNDTAIATADVVVEVVDLAGTSGDDVLVAGSGDDILSGGDGNDTITGGEGNDILSGGEGDDTFIFQASQGNDTVSGGDGWTDVIQLDGFAGNDSQQGWTLELEGGSTISSTDEDLNEILLSDDASGTITFDDGGTIDFDGIEKIVW